MSDIRALVAGRGIAVGDGAYHEHEVPPVTRVEEVLREWTHRLAIAPTWRTALT